MTKKEAIEILEQHQIWRSGLPPYSPQKLVDALNMAIKALKKIDALNPHKSAKNEKSNKITKKIVK